MAIGGGLQSSLPAHGIPDDEIQEATTSANEVIEELPNEAADIVVIDEDGTRLSVNQAARQDPNQDLPELRGGGLLGREATASSSQTTLTPDSSDNKAKTEKERRGSVGSVHDVERQLEAVEGVLEEGQEARLDFSKLGKS